MTQHKAPRTVPPLAVPRSRRRTATKHVATWGGAVLTAVFVAVFWDSRIEPQELDEVAPRAGLSRDEMLALGPRIASQSGGTLGSSRHVVFLLACSGLASKDTIETQAVQAGTMAKQRRLTDREAVAAVLADQSAGAGVGNLKDC